MDNKIKLRIKLWTRDLYNLLLFIFIGLASTWAFLYFFSSYLSDLSNPKSEIKEKAIQNIGAIYRFQQSHFFEKGNFANNYSELDFEPQSVNDYKFFLKNTENLALTYAVPTVDYDIQKKWLFSYYVDIKHHLYSYGGGIYYSQDSTFQTILCINNKAGKHIPNSPKIVYGKLLCSVGTKQIKQ
ncbi:MAG: type IV pilin-like G/H family protein [Pleurocapsa sp.]